MKREGMGKWTLRCLTDNVMPVGLPDGKQWFVLEIWQFAEILWGWGTRHQFRITAFHCSDKWFVLGLGISKLKKNNSKYLSNDWNNCKQKHRCSHSPPKGGFTIIKKLILTGGLCMWITVEHHLHIWMKSSNKLRFYIMYNKRMILLLGSPKEEIS